MEKTRWFPRVLFRPEHVEQIAADFRQRLDEQLREAVSLFMTVYLPGESWEHDQESEFFFDLGKEGATYNYRMLRHPYDLVLESDDRGTRAVVAAPRREDVEGVFQVIERLAPMAQVLGVAGQTAARTTTLIGHGDGPAWSHLRDVLQQQYGFRVVPYRIGARAGHAVRDLLDEMLELSSIAVLVVTPEDVEAGGEIATFRNVAYEAGLFQGRLGYGRAMILVQEGVEGFDLEVVDQVRFRQGGIADTLDEILGTVRREFPEDLA